MIWEKHYENTDLYNSYAHPAVKIETLTDVLTCVIKCENDWSKH